MQMATDESWRRVGGAAFLIGFIIAVIAGIAAQAIQPWAGGITLVLLILGLIVGFLNIADKEIFNFLIAVIGLATVGILTQLVAIPWIGGFLQSIVQRIAEFVTPAALIVSLKAVWKISKGV
jgi:hypothetical protein